jgi:hypothetical protein
MARSKGREVLDLVADERALQSRDFIVDICTSDGELFKEDVYVTGVDADQIRISGESNGYYTKHYRIFKRGRP